MYLVGAEHLGPGVAHQPGEEPLLVGQLAEHLKVRGMQHGLQ